jgi:hypothetical protein
MPAYRPVAPVRPGERREPITDVCLEESFIEAAGERGLSLPVAVELAVERALALDDLRRLGLSDVFFIVLERARRQKFTTPLPGSFQAYRRALLQVEPREIDATERARPVTLPLRFFPRVLGLDQRSALTAKGIEEARTLELAALCTARTMSEYVLYAACATARR